MPAAAHYILLVLCRYVGNYNNKTISLMKGRGTAQKGHASSTTKWHRKYSQYGDNVPPDVQGEVLLSACTVQTVFITSQPVPFALILQHTLLRRLQQCLASS